MDATFLQDRITATKALILVYEAALSALGSGAQSCKLDTGQTITWVTKAELSQLKVTLDGLYNTCAMLEARLNGSGSVMGVPAW